MDTDVRPHRASSRLPMRLTLCDQRPQSPTLEFVSRAQARTIPLHVSPAQARALAPFRGKAVEVTARVRYDEALEIVEGDLLDWLPLDEQASPMDALRAVFLGSRP